MANLQREFRLGRLQAELRKQKTGGGREQLVESGEASESETAQSEDATISNDILWLFPAAPASKMMDGDREQEIEVPSRTAPRT